MDIAPLRRAAGTAAGQAGRWAHIAATIARAGVVPFPDLVGGARELVPLVRYGTTLAGLYAMAAAATPDRLAVVDDDGAATFGELDRRVGALAHQLARRHGIAEGSAVGILARNSLGFLEVVLACSRLGADAVLLNTGMSPAQAATVVAQQEVRLLIADADLLDLLAEADGAVPRLCCGGGRADGTAGTTDELVAAGGSWTRAPREPGRTVVMTSGTTGAPKGARRPGTGGPDAAASILSRIPLRAEETTFIAPPLFHTWGYAQLQLAGMLRSTVVLRRRFDPAEVLHALADHRCTAMAVVPVMLQRILDAVEDDPGLPRPSDLRRHLGIVASSGSALPAGLAVRWAEAFGPTLYNLYGSTEVSWATIATPADLAAHPGTAGRPPRGTQLRILDDDGRPLPPGEVGRIFVANTLLFDGYARQGEGDGPAQKAVVDGLMATGDVGSVDEDGLLFVAGRDDDMIVSGGENVYPKEVEDVLGARDDVRDVAVVGVEDAGFGQRLVAFVVPRDAGAPPEGEALQAHVRERLARFSVPREVHLVDELPRNATGKVLVRELRARLEGGS